MAARSVALGQATLTLRADGSADLKTARGHVHLTRGDLAALKRTLAEPATCQACRDGFPLDLETCPACGRGRT